MSGPDVARLEAQVHPFRFGLQVRRSEDLAAVARQAEEVGYATLQVHDHLGWADPFVTLAAAAAVTRRIRLGTLVLNNEFWPPALTARAAATLDVISGGRVELGLGAGHMKSEFDAAGLTFHPASRRVTHLEQELPMLRRLLDGDVVSAAGERTVLAAHAQVPRPVQARLPLLVGGNGDRVLALAARLADIVSFTGFRHVEGTDEVDASHFDIPGLMNRVAVVRTAAGDRLADVELNLLVQHVEIAGSPEEAAERAARGWADGQMTPEEVNASPFVLTGTPSTIAEQLRRVRAETGVSYFTVGEPPGSPFDAVIRELSGS